MKNKLEELSIDLEKIEAYNNLITTFLENTIADANTSIEAPLLFLNNVKKDAKDYLVINYNLKETLEQMQKNLEELIKE